MKIVRSSLKLNEKFVGYIIGRRKGGEVRVIMNPTTLKGMGRDVRAVSTRDGDIFYANTDINYDIIHKDIINWMIANGYLSGSYATYNRVNGWRGIVCWQREGEEMLLSESYFDLDIDKDMMGDIEEMLGNLDVKDIDYRLKIK